MSIEPGLVATEVRAEIRAALAAAGDPERAEAQQRYMRSALPFHGVAMAEVRRIARQAARDHPFESGAGWLATLLTVWDGATHREERYAALTLARLPAARAWRDVGFLDPCEHLVLTGAWWDLVDEIAQHLVGDVLRRHREEATPRVRGWASSSDPWLRRTSVVCQLQHGAGTDLDLLHHAIEASADDPSFWLRKAIGWALRQHARTDPTWVRAELARLEGRLSPLTVREATKHL